MSERAIESNKDEDCSCKSKGLFYATCLCRLLELVVGIQVTLWHNSYVNQTNDMYLFLGYAATLRMCFTEPSVFSYLTLNMNCFFRHELKWATRDSDSTRRPLFPMLNPTDNGKCTAADSFKHGGPNFALR
ncbi:unnamed protein product [Cuscuta campestris]|uniref:Uncharacterized protein n=1 Tax=Cuscuta campestris TaxID=132261 RepID=A0A484MFS9_9ASTE|nr:unnamed protein product [Cuscuta campestris]